MTKQTLTQRVTALEERLDSQVRFVELLDEGVNDRLEAIESAMKLGYDSPDIESPKTPPFGDRPPLEDPPDIKGPKPPPF